MSNVVQLPSAQKAQATTLCEEAVAIDELFVHIIRAIRDDESITVHWDRSARRFVVESPAA